MLSSLIPKISDFTDEQIVEAGVKFLNKDRDFVEKLVSSQAGQEVLARLRDTFDESAEPQGIFHRCSNCGFAEELFLKS